jgi:hypothetical protein
MLSSIPSAPPDTGDVLTKALIRAALQLGLAQRELARAIGLSEATVSRLASGRTALDPESKDGELSVLVLRAFRSLDALLGGDGERMKAWLRAHNHHLGGVPAEQLQNVTGLVHVVEYLDAMRGKL